MRFGYRDICLEHDPGERHPESPDRLRAIREGLSRLHDVEYVTPKPATFDDLATVHDPDYLERVRAFCEDGGGRWDPDTVAVPSTWTAALASAGIARWVAKTAVDGPGERETPFGLGRPPGHHAVYDNAMGFCFVNNVAVGAQAAIDAGAADRVAILDWDVHHGNGTQDIFYDRGDVLYASIHEGGLYPGTGQIDEIGEGDGEGANVNVPLPVGAGDSAYRDAIDELVGPKIIEAEPDLLLVSAGFDAHRHDPISRMHVSTEGFGVLTQRVREVAAEVGAALGFVLEGGYSLDMLAEGVAMVDEVFGGREPVESEEPADEESRNRIDAVRRAHGLE